MIKVLSIFGTRPEAIKMAPVIRELEKYTDKIISRVFVTAQHRQMLDQVLEIFNIVPDGDLDVMKKNQTPIQVAARVMNNLEKILQKENPDWVLVQGDTTTVAAAALTAFYSKIKVGHVEAGLRTFDKMQPFPEEINRRVAGVIADKHFAPTNTAKQNLLNEGISDNNILVSGNTVIDALNWVASQPFNIDNVIKIPKDKKLLLVTAHRRENFGKPLENICLALKDIANEFKDQVRIVYPVHMNPNVYKTVYSQLKDIPNIHLIKPLDYKSLVHLMKLSTIVLTDSGGIQEEAPGLGKPVLVLREVTERPEAVIAGTVKLVGTNRKRIVEETCLLFENHKEYKKMAQAVNPYGDGHAAKRIVRSLLGEHVLPFSAK
jgi:UDP-N-acetylglucosamine 2-epimerase (non-hydrolysing)